MHACTKTDAEMDREVDTDTVARTNTQITHRPHVPLRRWYIVISWNRRWDFRHVSYIFFQTDWVFSHVRFRLGYEGAMRRLKIFGFSRFFIFSRQHIFSVACNYYFFEGSALGIFGGLVSCLVWRLSLLHGLEAFLWLTADTRVGPTFHLLLQPSCTIWFSAIARVISPRGAHRAEGPCLSWIGSTLIWAWQRFKWSRKIFARYGIARAL